MIDCSWRPLAGLALAIVLGACTNGGKNQRDTTGMAPSAAAGQVSGVGVGAAPVAADSITSRRDTLGGKAKAPGGRRRP
jgi:hypothetical protein